jgi:serine protease AprX
MVSKHLIFLIFLSFSLSLKSQDSLTYYFIHFKDKQNNPFSFQKPEQYLSEKALNKRKLKNIELDSLDLPVTPYYIEQLAQFKELNVLQASKWLNGVKVFFSTHSFDPNKVLALPFVKKIEFLAQIKRDKAPKPHIVENEFIEKFQYKLPIDSFKSNQLGRAQIQFEMIGSSNEINSTTQPIIAVFDAGFYMAYKTPGLVQLLSPDVVIKDFVDNDNSVWEDDKHGANCVGFINTFNPNNYIGTAPNALVYLMRTEDAKNENLTEEINWILAAEYSDKLGVDLISSSLGYNQFDHPETSHQYQDLDGKTTLIAQAAEIAFKKGIIIVNSAGNEGQSQWKKIGTPADANNVITIGAVNEEGFYANFSSQGPSFDGRIKPDFVAMGQQAIVASPQGFYRGNGTSYSTPIFAGAMANFYNQFPHITYSSLLTALKKSASHYEIPDNKYGYGIPDFQLATYILGKPIPNTDSLLDYLYNKPNAVFHQSLNIHFKSAHKQTIEIEIVLLKKKNKKRKYSINQFSLNKGEWLNSQLVNKTYQEILLSKKYRKIKSIAISLNSKDISSSQIISLR